MNANPRVVGRYLLFDAFAAGGMATVHLARLVGPGGFSRVVAIKQLHPQFASNPEFVSMLMEEAKLASRIRHSNVVSPLDVVVLEGEILVVMDYVHGESLARLLRHAKAPAPIGVVSAVMTQALLGLHAAHEATGANGEVLEMVHRDVSPQNILVGEDGVTRVVDFGIAKPRGWSHTTQNGVLKGKLGYMAPEQLRLEAVDRRTDIYTAGVVLWEMLTGKRLFSGDTLTLVAAQMAHAERELVVDSTVEVPDALRQIAATALATDPQHRYRTAWEMAAAIAALVRPATPLEVRAWVTELAGAALRDRAQRLAVLEALHAEDVPQSDAAVELPALNRPVPLAALSAAEITPSAVTVPPPLRRAGRARQAALLAALTLATLSVLAVGSKRLWTGSNLVRESPVSTLARTVAGTGQAAEPVLALVRAPASPLDTGASPPTIPSALARGAATRAPAAVASATHGARVHSPTAPHPACEVPFTIDANGVKRFKPECF